MDTEDSQQNDRVDEFLASSPNVSQLNAYLDEHGGLETRRKLENYAFERGIELRPTLSSGTSQATPPSPGSRSTLAVDARLLRDVTSHDDNFGAKQSGSQEGVLSLKQFLNRILSEKIGKWLFKYKRYYLFSLVSAPTDWKALLIYDAIPFPELLKRELTSFRTISLENFLLEIKEGSSDLWHSSSLCLLVLSELSSNVESFLNLETELYKFTSFKYLELMPNDSEWGLRESEGEYLFDELKRDLHISLTNAHFDKSVESLIKKFFNPDPSLISYRRLKGGFSGSSVIEVSQVFVTAEPLKYVIKVGARKDKKIKIEEAAVKRWVANRDSNYQTEIKSNATHDAIKYLFAANGARGESRSFSTFYKEESSEAIRRKIESLFSLNLFKQWEETQINEDQKVPLREVFESYLKVDKIFSATFAISFEHAESNKAVFEKLLNYQVQRYMKKVSHGDLHSENIIIDGDSVFLIDFGMTDYRPVFIDYAMLEVSIRFGLLPRYIPTKEIMKIDSKYIQDLNLSERELEEYIANADIKKAYKVISMIRRKAVETINRNKIKFDSLKELESHYLLTLFSLTLRNLPYGDLNQKYAVCFARELSHALVTRLDL